LTSDSLYALLISLTTHNPQPNGKKLRAAPL
jgi:hypothetical protein